MNFIPENDYEGLLAQAKAMHRIIEAMEKSKSIQGKAVDDLTRQLLVCGKDHLESEREANHILTDQVSKLEQQRDQLKVEVEALKPYRDNHHDLMRHMAEHDAEVIDKAMDYAIANKKGSGIVDYHNALVGYMEQLRQKAQEKTNG